MQSNPANRRVGLRKTGVVSGRHKLRGRHVRIIRRIVCVVVISILRAFAIKMANKLRTVSCHQAVQAGFRAAIAQREHLVIILHVNQMVVALLVNSVIQIV